MVGDPGDGNLFLQILIRGCRDDNNVVKAMRLWERLSQCINFTKLVMLCFINSYNLGGYTSMRAVTLKGSGSSLRVSCARKQSSF